MGPMEESWQNYERQRRRLNARLGLMVFALLPLPAILIAVGLSPLRMLLVVASLGVSIGILYPMWWRTKHNPLRASAVESANAADCLGLPAKRVSLRPRSDVVLVGGKRGRANGLLWHSALRPLCCCGSRISPIRKQSKSCDPRDRRFKYERD